MRAQGASALNLASTEGAGVELVPQIFPATAAKRVDAGKRRTAAKSKPSQESKVRQENKAIQRRRSTAGQKRGAKAASDSKHRSLAKNAEKLKPAADEKPLPQIIHAEAVVETKRDTTLITSYEPISLVPPIPTFVEKEPVDDSTFEFVTDQPITEVPAAIAGAEVKTDESVLREPSPATVAEKPTLTQAFAVQLRSLFQIATRAWLWAQQKLKSHHGKKRLRVCETVSLGEKRFVAVIQVDGEQFLVGGSSSSVSTLAHLEPRPEFSEVFRHCEQDLSQA